MLDIVLGIFEILFICLKYIVSSVIPFNLNKEKDVSADTVLITGGGSGIGRILAQKFASLGSSVIIIDINEDGMNKTRELIQRTGGLCKAYKCDISSREDVYETAEKIKEEMGFVSILINNAGIVGNAKRVSEMDDEKVIQTMNVNVFGCIWMTKAFLPDMISENRGHITFISSYAGLSGAGSLSDYCTSKFAVVGFADSLGLELRGDGYENIHVTTVCPWVIDTGLFAGARNPYIPTLEPRFAANRIMEAILRNESIVYLPRIVYLLVFLKSILPAEAAIKLYMILEGYTFMDGFTGREKKILDTEDEMGNETVNDLGNKGRKMSRSSLKKASLTINGMNNNSNED